MTSVGDDSHDRRIEVLGAVRVFHGTAETTPPGRLQRRLIAALVAAENGLDNADLCRILWDDPDQDARLHLLVHRTRAAVEDTGLIERTASGYRLAVPAEAIDLFALEDERDPAVVLAAVEQEVFGGCHGDFFDEQRVRLRGRLDELRRTALRAAHDDALVLGAIGPARESAPYDEDLAELHMRALARSGRVGEALTIFDDMRRRLADELGTDPGERLRALHLRLVSGEPADIAPAELPLHVDRLIGREREQAVLDSLLADEIRVGVIAGMGGVGKTALAVTWADARREAFPDGILYADLRGFSGSEPVGPESVLRRFLRGLGVSAPVSRGLDELAALFRSVIDGRRMLVLLDNARDEQQVRPLLPGARGGTVLITSRRSLPGLVTRARVRAIELEPLGAEAAAALAAEHAAESVSADLARLCGGLPLAIVVAASSASSSSDAPRSRAQLRELLDSDDDESSVETVLSWSLDALDEEERRLFRLLGLATAPITVEAVTALAGGPEPAAVSGRIRRLLRAHLLSDFDGVRVVQHDLVRDVARARLVAESDDRERTEAFRRLLAHYEYATDAAVDRFTKGFEVSFSPVLDTRATEAVALPPEALPRPVRTVDDAVAWLERERRALLDVLRGADEGSDAQVVRVILRIRGYVVGQSYLNDAGEFFDELLRRAARSGDRTAQASALRLLGGIDSFTNGLAVGRRRLEEALRLSESIDDVIGIRTAANNLGELARLADDFETAEEWFTHALTGNRQGGDRVRIALNLANLALCGLGRGDLAAAERYAREALSEAEDAGSERSRAVAHRALGEIELRQGRVAAAREAAAVADEIGRRIVYVEGDLRVRMLAERVRFAEGDHAAAVSGLERIVAEAGGDGLIGEHRDALRHLGELYRQLGDAERAARCAEEARALHARLTRGFGASGQSATGTRSVMSPPSASPTAEASPGTRVTWEHASSSGS